MIGTEVFWIFSFLNCAYIWWVILSIGPKRKVEFIHILYTPYAQSKSHFIQYLKYFFIILFYTWSLWGKVCIYLNQLDLCYVSTQKVWNVYKSFHILDIWIRSGSQPVFIYIRLKADQYDSVQLLTKGWSSSVG